MNIFKNKEKEQHEKQKQQDNNIKEYYCYPQKFLYSLDESKNFNDKSYELISKTSHQGSSLITVVLGNYGSLIKEECIRAISLLNYHKMILQENYDKEFETDNEFLHDLEYNNKYEKEFYSKIYPINWDLLTDSKNVFLDFAFFFKSLNYNDYKKFNLNDDSVIGDKYFYFDNFELNNSSSNNQLIAYLLDQYDYFERNSKSRNFKNSFKIILPMTYEYWNTISSSYDIKDKVNIVKILDADELKTKKVLEYHIYDKYKIYDISDNVLDYLVKESSKYSGKNGMVNPGLAKYILKETISNRIFNSMIDLKISYSISIEDIKMTISDMNNNIDLEDLSLDNIKDKLKSKIVGQDQTLDKISEGIKIGSFKELYDKKKPIYSVLLFGESGIGKTLLSEEVSSLVSKEKNLLRIDCGELKDERIAIAHLLGTAPSYKNYEKGGILINFAKKHSSGTILLDEFEKSNENVQDVFLRIIDTGKINDPLGGEVSFENFVFIFTTNAGIKKETKVRFTNYVDNNEKENNIDLLENYFKPEFLYRLDDILELKSLTYEDLKNISMKTILNSIDICKKTGKEINITKKEIKDLSSSIAKTSRNGRQAYRSSQKAFARKYLLN